MIRSYERVAPTCHEPHHDAHMPTCCTMPCHAVPLAKHTNAHAGQEWGLHHTIKQTSSPASLTKSSAAKLNMPALVPKMVRPTRHE